MGRLLPVMDQAKLDLQRDVVKNERRQSYDNVPYGRANETIVAALFRRRIRTHWPTIGSMTDLSAASLDDVKEFFRTYYAPNNATLVIAGDFNRDSVITWVQPVFRRHSARPADAARARRCPRSRSPRDTFLVLEDKVTLPRLYETWHSVKLFHPDDAPLDVLADVLAGDKNSRLYKRLVFDMQVAQDVSAFQQQRQARRLLPDHRDAEAGADAGEDGGAGGRGAARRSQTRRRHAARARALAQQSPRVVPGSAGLGARQGGSARVIQLHRGHAGLRAAGSRRATSE